MSSNLIIDTLTLAQSRSFFFFFLNSSAFTFENHQEHHSSLLCISQAQVLRQVQDHIAAILHQVSQEVLAPGNHTPVTIEGGNHHIISIPAQFIQVPNDLGPDRLLI